MPKSRVLAGGVTLLSFEYTKRGLMRLVSVMRKGVVLPRFAAICSEQLVV